MTPPKRQKVALVGNPNSGKSSLFNQLTGLKQKIGNFPGVTVEKRSGLTTLPDGSTLEIIDLPGIYSIYPRSLDEQIVSEILLNHRSTTTPDKIVVIADATNLKRGLLLLSQIMDVGLPTILALNMMDLVAKAGISYDLKKLSAKLGIPVVAINARMGIGLQELKKVIAGPVEPPAKPVFPIWDEARKPVKELREKLGVDNDYEAYQFLEQPRSLNFLSRNDRQVVDEIRTRYNFTPGKFQGAETIQRYGFIQDLLNEVTLKQTDFSWKNYSRRIDKVVTHKVWGYLLFFGVLFLIFQAIFAWATLPMDLIDVLFADLSQYLHGALPDGPLTSLLADGLIPGI